jgi:hypothetical protein
LTRTVDGVIAFASPLAARLDVGRRVVRTARSTATTSTSTRGVARARANM